MKPHTALLFILAALLFLYACTGIPNVSGEGAALGVGAGAAVGIGVASIATAGAAFIAAAIVGVSVLFFSKATPIEHTSTREIPVVPPLFWIIGGAIVLVLFLTHHPRVRAKLSNLFTRQS